MKKLLAVAVAALVAGCATTVDLTQTKLAVATHADLQGAAMVFSNAGYPERAAVVTAIDAQLTACEKAITAAEPKAPAPTVAPGPFTLAAQAAVATGQFTGIPASVKLNCEPIPVVIFPSLKLP